MWPLTVLSVLVLAVVGNGVFWRLDAPPLLVAEFDVALLLPLLLCALNVPLGWGGPTVDECLDRLRRAGWSIGDTGHATNGSARHYGFFRVSRRVSGSFRPPPIPAAGWASGPKARGAACPSAPPNRPRRPAGR